MSVDRQTFISPRFLLKDRPEHIIQFLFRDRSLYIKSASVERQIFTYQSSVCGEIDLITSKQCLSRERPEPIKAVSVRQTFTCETSVCWEILYISKQCLLRDRPENIKAVSVQRQTFTYQSNFCSETGIYVRKQFLFKDRHLHMKAVSVQRQAFTYERNFCSETDIYIWKQFLFRDRHLHMKTVSVQRHLYISKQCLLRDRQTSIY
jgi:hypothetical protein